MNKKKFFLYIKIIFIILIIIFVVYRFNYSKIIIIVSGGNLEWSGLALILLALAFFFYSWRWRVILHGFWPYVKLSTFSLFRYNLLAIFYSLLIPTAITTEATRIVRLSRKVNNDFPKSTISSALDRILGGFIYDRPLGNDG